MKSATLPISNKMLCMAAHILTSTSAYMPKKTVTERLNGHTDVHMHMHTHTVAPLEAINESRITPGC